MKEREKLHIWLAYVSYPVTTAVYIERALRRKYRVTTIGPQLPPRLIEAWDLKNLKLPILPLNINTGFDVDVKKIKESLSNDFAPDFYLWVESVDGYFPKNINSLGCPTACYLIDSHVNLQKHLEWAKNFDFVFIAQREYLKEFKEKSNPNTFWLPLAADPIVHSKKSEQKFYDVGFVGSVNSALHKRRIYLLNKIKKEVNLHYERCFDEEMADVLSKSRIVFNNAIKNDLNMRVFETLSVGSFLLTDRTYNNGQDEMFIDGEDLVVYEDEEIVEKIKFYLNHEELREKIARRGNQIALAAHTYFHRTEELLNVVTGKKKETNSPEEWRRLSLKKNSFAVNLPKNNAPKIEKSFVIPVLDMSPSSPYNIEILLDDLKKIDGEVIVVFNSKEIYEKFKDHPRIDEFALMKHNVGVSRAWNIGLNIARGKITFICNADLHIQPEAVEKLFEAINNLPGAAIVGPQGSYLNIETGKVIKYFEKGKFHEPIQVDEVSGFFFAVRTELFNSNVLHFDNQYTPCYFEEWDIALQAKLAGFNLYVVPVSEFQHEWGGSIGSFNRPIDYYGQTEYVRDIYSRNKRLFNEKWKTLSAMMDEPELLISVWVKNNLARAENMIENQNWKDALKILTEINSHYPGYLPALELMAKIGLKIGDNKFTLQILEMIEKIDPEYKINLNEFETIGVITNNNNNYKEVTNVSL